jgi:hypothetical protein
VAQRFQRCSKWIILNLASAAGAHFIGTEKALPAS